MTESDKKLTLHDFLTNAPDRTAVIRCGPFDDDQREVKMAHKTGKPTWAFSGTDGLDEDEQQAVEQQAVEFCQKHSDIIGPLLDRIKWLKSIGTGDDLLLMSSVLVQSGYELIKYVRACEAAAKDSA